MAASSPRALVLQLLLSLVPCAQVRVVPRSEEVKPASDEWKAALAGIQVPDGFEVALWAAEPMLANPVGLCIDDKGVVYVAETYRIHDGCLDQRDFMSRLAEDLACRTVEERVAMYRRHGGETFEQDFRRASERVTRIADVDGDGRADRWTVFAEGFNDPAEGLGAAVLAHAGGVYFTNMPSLWLLRDEDGDGTADERRVLSSGYGVHTAMIGHDLHGLCIGPDGRLYFSCGDRGLNLTTREGVHLELHTGSILRCELDGSGLEVYATGLRNPQDLVFNALGDLFTGDNNGDGGDLARFEHIVEGQNCGWNHPTQWVTAPTLRGPWNEDQLWKPRFDGQAAYIVPPIANVGAGPSGITVNFGTGLPREYDGCLLLVDFTGSPEGSTIRRLKLEPHGASYKLVEEETFVRGILATDCEFGPDGGLYVSDWVEGWNKTGKGRIWRIAPKGLASNEQARETQGLLNEGMAGRGAGELALLLAHSDQRVRQNAQFALVERGDAGHKALALAALKGLTLPARLHGIRGLGMAARLKQASVSEHVLRLLQDSNPEVRAHAARLAGELGLGSADAVLAGLLVDASPRVRLQAALALGHLRAPGSVAPLCALLREIGEQDPALRHAAVMGLARNASSAQIEKLAADPSVDVRIGAVVALRRQASFKLASFMSDGSERVRAEAARAIYDLFLDEALPALADRLPSEGRSQVALARRALNACFRLGGEPRAQQLADFAARTDGESAFRVEALQRLSQWEKPPALDPVVGDYRPITARPADYVPHIVWRLGERGIDTAPAEVVLAWLACVGTCKVVHAAPLLSAWIADPKRDLPVRVAALEALSQLDHPTLAPAVQAALADSSGDLRAAGLQALGRISPKKALPLIQAMLARGELAERRAAYEVLANASDPAGDELLLEQLQLHANGLVPDELALDLLSAAESHRSNPAIALVLAAREQSRAADALLAPWLDTLHGGDPERGQKLFREKGETACVRCHKAGEDEGGEVGPGLKGIGRRLARLSLLETIVAPNRRIAAGYENNLFLLKDGTAVDGRILSEVGRRLKLCNSKNEIVEIDVDEIELRKSALSAMPENLCKDISREEMRDLIEYLSRL